jgi:DNA-binding NarL/FixJ family response regulator
LGNANSQSVLNILITAAFPALRSGLAALVESDPALRVIAQCASPFEWGPHIARTDVLILAPLQALSNDWLQSIAQTAPAKPVLLLAQQPLSSLPGFASRVWGLLPFTTSSDEINLALRALSKGLWIAAPDLLPRALLESAETAPTPAGGDFSLIENLTRRELEVLQCLALGFANKEIARRLDISIETVKYHTASIYSKLGVNNRTEAVRSGVRQGLINL